MDLKKLKSRIVEAGLFDPKYYKAQYPDVVAVKALNPDVDPLDHYVLIGSRLGRLPHPAFSPADLPPADWDAPPRPCPSPG